MTLMLTLTKRERKKRIPLYRKISHTRHCPFFSKSVFRSMPQLIGSIFYLACRLKEKFYFKRMPKKKFSGLLACQIKIGQMSCGTVLKLRLPGLRACPSMWDFTVNVLISKIQRSFSENLLIINIAVFINRY